MKHNQYGFTLIELIVVVVLIALIALMVFTASDQKSAISWGVNGITETRCIAGFKHVVGEGGQARQVLDENGRGVKCND